MPPSYSTTKKSDHRYINPCQYQQCQRWGPGYKTVANEQTSQMTFAKNADASRSMEIGFVTGNFIIFSFGKLYFWIPEGNFLIQNWTHRFHFFLISELTFINSDPVEEFSLGMIVKHKGDIP